MRRILVVFLIIFTLGVTLTLISSYIKQLKSINVSKANPTSFEDPNGVWSLAEYSKDLPNYSIEEDLYESRGLPTNKWFTGALNSQNITPIYPLPYSILFGKDKIGYSTPQKTVAGKAIFQSYSEDFFLNLGSDLTYKLSYYDQLIAKFNVYNFDKQKIANVTLQRGSPLFWIEVLSSFQLKIGNVNEVKFTNSNDVVFLTNNKLTYLKATSDFNFDFSDNLITLSTQSATTFSLGYLNSESLANQYSEIALNIPISAKVNLNIDDNKTSIEYLINTSTGNSSLFGLLPIQKSGYSEDGIFSINTIRGDMDFFQGNSFMIQLESISPNSQLDFNNLTDAQLNELSSYLEKDKLKLSITETSMYFIGKQLFRLSNMLDISEYLDTKLGGKRSNEIKIVIKNELKDWFSYLQGEQNKYLAYDSERKGLVAVKPDFGSENYNDHHFHYGYFIYAFATISKYDTEFYAEYKNIVDLMVKDIANQDSQDNSFPYLRYFDLFELHSWANGTDNFADGNNQESVSEAINAWHALFKLGEVSKSAEYTKLGELLYTLETSAAKEYWWNYNNNQNIFPYTYDYPIASLVWQGKIEYNTFFTDDSNAKLAIIMLPFSAGSKYLVDQSASQRIYDYYQNNKGTLFDDMLNLYFMMNKLPYDQDILGWSLDSSNSFSYCLLMQMIYNK